jgi:hypothetical protein
MLLKKFWNQLRLSVDFDIKFLTNIIQVTRNIELSLHTFPTKQIFISLFKVSKTSLDFVCNHRGQLYFFTAHRYESISNLFSFIAGHVGDLGRGIRLGRGGRRSESADARTAATTKAAQFEVKQNRTNSKWNKIGQIRSETKSDEFELKLFEKLKKIERLLDLGAMTASDCCKI